MNSYSTQNDLLLNTLIDFYKKDGNLDKMLDVINGNTKISLRIIDWFSTNYAKKNFTVYEHNGRRFKVYIDYKLKLKAYSKRRFDPFCRWERICIPYKEDSEVQTTIGQLNFFKWAIDNGVINYVEQNYDAIEADMNSRNSTSKKKQLLATGAIENKKTRKKREELSVSASKSIKKENVEIVVSFD